MIGTYIEADLLVSHSPSNARGDKLTSIVSLTVKDDRIKASKRRTLRALIPEFLAYLAAKRPDYRADYCLNYTSLLNLVPQRKTGSSFTSWS